MRPSPACCAACSAWFPAPPPTSRTCSAPPARSPARRFTTRRQRFALPRRAATDRAEPGGSHRADPLPRPTDPPRLGQCQGPGGPGRDRQVRLPAAPGRPSRRQSRLQRHGLSRCPYLPATAIATGVAPASIELGAVRLGRRSAALRNAQQLLLAANASQDATLQNTFAPPPRPTTTPSPPSAAWPPRGRSRSWRRRTWKPPTPVPPAPPPFRSPAGADRAVPGEPRPGPRRRRPEQRPRRHRPAHGPGAGYPAAPLRRAGGATRHRLRQGHRRDARRSPPRASGAARRPGAAESRRRLGGGKPRRRPAEPGAERQPGTQP